MARSILFKVKVDYIWVVRHEAIRIGGSRLYRIGNRVTYASEKFVEFVHYTRWIRYLLSFNSYFFLFWS
jgi:hypothetical protein